MENQLNRRLRDELLGPARPPEGIFTTFLGVHGASTLFIMKRALILGFLLKYVSLQKHSLFREQSIRSSPEYGYIRVCRGIRMHHSEVQGTWNLLFDEGTGLFFFEFFHFIKGFGASRIFRLLGL